MQSRTPGMALRRASGMSAPQSAQWARPGPCGSRLCARRMPSVTVASICSCTAPSPAQPVAMGLFYASGGCAPTWARERLPRCEVGVEPKQGSRHAVRPAEAVLQGILAPTAWKGVFDVVFLDELARVGEHPLNRNEPAARDLVRERRLIVAAQAADRDPLQGRPPVRRIPLLSGGDVGGDDAALLEQLHLRDRADGIRLPEVGDAGEERIESRCGELAGPP